MPDLLISDLNLDGTLTLTKCHNCGQDFSKSKITHHVKRCGKKNTYFFGPSNPPKLPEITQRATGMRKGVKRSRLSQPPLDEEWSIGWQGPMNKL